MLPMSTTNTDYSLSSHPFLLSVRLSVCLSVPLSVCLLPVSCIFRMMPLSRFVFGGRFLRCSAMHFVCSFIARVEEREGQLRRRLRRWQRSTCVSARVLCFICLPLILRVGGSTLTEFEVTPHTHTHTYTQSLLQLKVLSAACHHYRQRQQQQQRR